MSRRHDKRTEDYQAGFEEALTRIYNTMYGLMKAFEDAAGEDLDPLTTAQLSHIQTSPLLISVHAEFQKWYDLFDNEDLKKLFKTTFIKPVRQRLLALQPFLVKMMQIIEKEPPQLWRGEDVPPGMKMFAEFEVAAEKEDASEKEGPDEE